MITAANSAINVAKVFRLHGIHIGIGAPIMHIQELAMAINLVGKHDVLVEYRRSVAAPGGHSLTVMTKHHHEEWASRTGISREIDLPSRASNEADRTNCIQTLGEVANQLGAILQEGQPS